MIQKETHYGTRVEKFLADKTVLPLERGRIWKTIEEEKEIRRNIINVREQARAKARAKISAQVKA